MRQHGFGSITLYAAVGAALVIAGLSIALKVKSARLEAVKQEYAGFVAQVKAVGEVAQAKADKERIDRKAITDAQERENVKRYKDLSDRYAAARRVLNTSSGSNSVPALSSAASIISCPDRQADAAGRLERLEIGVLDLIERGDKAIQRTIDCKAWLDGQIGVK